jgi:hypothetical protein
MKQDEKIDIVKNVAKKVREAHEYLMLEFGDNASRIDKLEMYSKDQAVTISLLEDTKLDSRIFDKKLESVDLILNSC